MTCQYQKKGLTVYDLLEAIVQHNSNPSCTEPIVCYGFDRLTWSGFLALHKMNYENMLEHTQMEREDSGYAVYKNIPIYYNGDTSKSNLGEAINSIRRLSDLVTAAPVPLYPSSYYTLGYTDGRVDVPTDTVVVPF